MSSKAVDWDLLKLLECPACMEYMASAITICEEGHSICTNCNSRVWACPTCEAKFIKTRNITLEKIAALIIYPCKNREAGCEETFTLDEINSHQSECLYQIRECPFRKLSGVNCPWTGILLLTNGHVKSEHWSETSETGRHFKVRLLNVSTSRRYRRAVFISDELFYLVWEIRRIAFYFSVFHFGHRKDNDVFKYSIKIGNSEGHISTTRVCHRYLEDNREALEPGNCATFHYGAVEEYLSEGGHLSCEIEIGAETLNGSADQLTQECTVVEHEVSDSSDNDDLLST
jgi:hypothetical protein